MLTSEHFNVMQLINVAYELLTQILSLKMSSHPGHLWVSEARVFVMKNNDFCTVVRNFLFFFFCGFGGILQFCNVFGYCRLYCAEMYFPATFWYLRENMNASLRISLTAYGDRFPGKANLDRFRIDE